MEKVLRVLADDIAIGLVKEWRRRKAVPVLPAPKVHDNLIERLAQELESREDNIQSSNFSEQEILLQRLQQVESTLEKLATRIRSGQGEYEVGSDLLIERLAQELVSREDNVRTRTSAEQQTLLQQLQQVESTLGIIATQIRSGQEEYEEGSDRDGESSKYQNVESLLKYVDGPGSEGGVKLVIMNFND